MVFVSFIGGVAAYAERLQVREALPSAHGHAQRLHGQMMFSVSGHRADLPRVWLMLVMRPVRLDRHLPVPGFRRAYCAQLAALRAFHSSPCGNIRRRLLKYAFLTHRLHVASGNHNHQVHES